jgi:hypothetical protein
MIDIVYWSSVEFVDIYQQGEPRYLIYYPGAQSLKDLGIVPF